MKADSKAASKGSSKECGRRPAKQLFAPIAKKVASRRSTPDGGYPDGGYRISGFYVAGKHCIAQVKDVQLAKTISEVVYVDAISPIVFELMMHLRLVSRALIERKHYFLVEELLRPLISDIANTVSRYQQACIDAMGKKPLDQLANTVKLNDKLASLREELVEKYQVELLSALFRRGLLMNLSVGELQRRFCRAVASDAQYYVDTGKQVSIISNTQGTAHAKSFAAKSSHIIVNTCDRITGKRRCWVRAPSLAATDEFQTASDHELVQDVVRKLHEIVNSFSPTPQSGDIVYYNLYTFNRAKGPSIDWNDQEKSCRIIIKAIHQYNRGRRSGPLILLNNLSVNGWGPSAPGKAKSPTGEEAFVLAELSAFVLLRGRLGSLKFDRIADKFIAAYRLYLKEGRENKNFYCSVFYKQGHPDLSQHAEIAPRQMLGPRLSTSNLLAALLYQLLYHRQLLYRKNGMLVQAISKALQTHSINGCKSANERTFFVDARTSLLLSSALDEVLTTCVRKCFNKKDIKQDIQALSDVLARVLNLSLCSQSRVLLTVSCHDQGALPKVGVRGMCCNTTNDFVHPLLTTWKPGDSYMQAHKVVKAKASIWSSSLATKSSYFFPSFPAVDNKCLVNRLKSLRAELIAYSRLVVDSLKPQELPTALRTVADHVQGCVNDVQQQLQLDYEKRFHAAPSPAKLAQIQLLQAIINRSGDKSGVNNNSAELKWLLVLRKMIVEFETLLRRKAPVVGGGMTWLLMLGVCATSGAT